MTNRSSELKFLLKHSAIYGVGTILSRAVAFILLPLYTRYLTPTDYGMIELIDTTTGLIGIVVGLGISTSLSRFYYDGRDERDRNTVVSTVYILIALGSTGLLLIANAAAPTLADWVLDGSKYASYFRVAFVGLLLGIVADVGQSYLRMLYKSVLFITLSTVQLVIGVALNVFFIVELRLGVLGILYTSVIVRVLVALPLTAVILWRTGLRFSRRDAVGLLKYSLPLLPSTLGTAVMNYSDRYFIKHFMSLADAGVYSLAKKLGGTLHLMVTGPFISTFQPRRFQLVRERPDARELFQNVFDAFFLILLFVSLVFAVFVPEVMSLMTTPAFFGAGPLVPVVLLSMLVFAMKYHVDFGILYAQRTEYYMYANVATAVIQIVGGFFLVRSFGMWGAVWAQLLSTIVNFALLHRYSARFYPIPIRFWRHAKVLTLASAVYFASRYIVTDHLAVVIISKTLLLGAYLAALPLGRLVSPTEVAELRAFVRSIGRRVSSVAASAPV